MIKYTKYIGLLLICLNITMAQAYTSCNGGSENGTHTLCRSNAQMTWWSAVLWCRSNGGTLASMATVCPTKTPGEGCSTWAGGFVWLNDLAGDKSYAIGNPGYLYPIGATSRTTRYYALCE